MRAARAALSLLLCGGSFARRRHPSERPPPADDFDAARRFLIAINESQTLGPPVAWNATRQLASAKLVDPEAHRVRNLPGLRARGAVTSGGLRRHSDAATPFVGGGGAVQGGSRRRRGRRGRVAAQRLRRGYSKGRGRRRGRRVGGARRTAAAVRARAPLRRAAAPGGARRRLVSEAKSGGEHPHRPATWRGRHWAGMIDADDRGGGRLFYWFFERDPPPKPGEKPRGNRPLVGPDMKFAR